MSLHSVVRPLTQETRQRGLVLFFAIASLTLGVSVGLTEASAWLPAGLFLAALILAWSVPIRALPVVLAPLAVLQFYFFVPGSKWTLSAAIVFIAAASVRVLSARGIRGQTWLVPAAVFLSAAFIAALGAADRAAALKGIYQWGWIFACVFVAAQTDRPARTFNHVSLVLVGLGMAQALLGAIQYTAGTERVLAALTTPISDLFFTPNVLRERLSDQSLNWLVAGRVLPFGTFVNGIDYALYLAGAIVLALARALSSLSHAARVAWLTCVLAMGTLLVLTLKGTGFIALAGGVLTLGIFWAPRASRAVGLTVLVAGMIALTLAAFYAEPLIGRAAFLIEREQSTARDLGRFRIWSRLASAWTDRPVFGYGMNNSAPLGESLRTLKNGVFGTYPSAPENTYIQVLVETGAVGLIALLSLMGMTIARGRRMIRAHREPEQVVGALAALGTLWAGSLTLSAFTTDQHGMLIGLWTGLVFARWIAD